MRLSVSRLAGLALLSVASACAATDAESPVDLSTEKGLAVLLDRLESSYETACTEAGEAALRYRASGMTQGAEALDAAERKLAAVYRDPDLGQAIDRWAGRNTDTDDPTLLRRIRMWQATRLTAGVDLDPEISSLARSLERRMASHRYTVGGRSATRRELERILAADPDRDLRRSAWMARAALARDLDGDLRRLILLRALRSRDLGVHYYHHVVLRSQDHDPTWLFNVLEMMMRRSAPAYTGLAELLRRAAGVEELAPWDLRYAMTARSTSRGIDAIAKRAFPAGRAESALRTLVAGIGFDYGKLPIRIEWADPLEDSFGVPLRIPDDYRVVLNRDLMTDGPFLYETLFHQFGHGLQAVRTARKEPMFKGYTCVAGARGEAYAEGMADWMAGFIRDPVYLEKRLGLKPEEIAVVLEDREEWTLLWLRETLLRLGTEFTFYVNPEADLDSRYRTLYSKALAITPDPSVPVPWQDDILLVSHPFGSYAPPIGATIGRGLRMKMRELFGEDRIDNAKVAAWLDESCYRDGERLPALERMHERIDRAYDFPEYARSPGVLEEDSK